MQIRDEISEGFFRAALATLQHRNDPVDPVVELLIQPPQYRMTLIGWYALGRILQETSSLNCLSIAECAISNQILMAIASAIFANSTLEMIDLTRLMQGGLPVPRVNETDPMSRARIETWGFPHVLWQISRSNMPLKKITLRANRYLQECNLDDLVSVIKQHKATLEFVDLSYCSVISGESWVTISRAFKDQSALQELHLQYGGELNPMRREFVHQITHLRSLKRLTFGEGYQLPQNYTDVISNTLLNTTSNIKPMTPEILRQEAIKVIGSHHNLMELEVKHAREEDSKLIAELLHLNNSGKPKHVGLAKVALYLDINDSTKHFLPYIIANGLAKLSDVTFMYKYLKRHLFQER